VARLASLMLWQLILMSVLLYCLIDGIEANLLKQIQRLSPVFKAGLYFAL
jgi:hypothetical protein